jgi:hypothetical protein
MSEVLDQLMAGRVNFELMSMLAAGLGTSCAPWRSSSRVRGSRAGMLRFVSGSWCHPARLCFPELPRHPYHVHAVAVGGNGLPGIA